MATPLTLTSLRLGDCATIVALDATADVCHRLSALGLRPGNIVRLIRRARFAGPLHVRVGTTELMLRRQEARCILIHKPAG